MDEENITSPEPLLIESDLSISIIHTDEQTDFFNETRKVAMHPNFLNVKDTKKHNITNHARRFKNKINLNHRKEEVQSMNKRRICIVDFGMNIGSEINGIRPVIVYKASNYKYGEDITVLPITSFESEEGEEKSKDSLDIVLEEDKANGIDHKSLIKIRQIRCVSRKRFRRDKQSDRIKSLGVLMDKNIQRAINENIIKMFGLDEND
ncbi:MAG: type II toxin-antitoxin system PemK/MazF family toxin [Candidatus Peribacteria bacterium]|jgi:mRNA-degrading endonuclease toxin of MazEF toxin-antitoxin module|nr:type II toxin-antitoxin system PemK/MazF family toxin [Candidatus Peribacteria bacterium]